MPINFNFKSFTDYLFPTSTRTDGASGASTAQAGQGSPTFSFSAMRNGGWAKKCETFDAAKLALTIRNDPRTKKAVETAMSGLNSLYRQMTVLVKNLRADLNNFNLQGAYRPTDEEHRINVQWRAYLPPGAVIMPGSTFDAHNRIERISWRNERGQVWVSTHNLNNGQRHSTTGWKMDHGGWQRSQSIDHSTGEQWDSRRNLATGQHTGHTAWSGADAQGWQRCKMFDHNTQTNWTSFHHAGTNQSYCATAWSKPGEDGVKSRMTIDQNTETRWHETYNTKTGEHVAKSDWVTDLAGVRQRTVKNHTTGETSVEHGAPAEPGAEQADFSFNTKGRTAEELATQSLKILGLDKNETDMTKIKKQYRQLALKLHPDKVADKSDTAAVAKAEEAFKKLQHAYEFLNSEHFPVKKEGA